MCRRKTGHYVAFAWVGGSLGNHVAVLQAFAASLGYLVPPASHSHEAAALPVAAVVVLAAADSSVPGTLADVWHAAGGCAMLWAEAWVAAAPAGTAETAGTAGAVVTVGVSALAGSTAALTMIAVASSGSAMDVPVTMAAYPALAVASPVVS